jgi:iron complex outermembrane receptor protein
MKQTLASTLAILLLLCAGRLLAAEPVVRGRVHDAERAPLPGVRVAIEHLDESVETGLDGRFAIAVPARSSAIVLLFEKPAYRPERRAVALPATAELEVELAPLRQISETVTVTATRVDIPLDENPAATTLVGRDALVSVPRGIGAEEALRTVPGVKVDNQANGERVHLSMRGQGILTERGVRGIQVLLDGIPINDPSGFAPDLYDVDWADVDRIDVVRGPVGFLFGGGSSGGVVSIRTQEGGDTPLGADAWASGGSNAFYKLHAAAGGSSGALDYSLSVARTEGDGYRDHTAFWGNNLYGRLDWKASPRFRLSAVVAATGYFNQNAEGLNLAWLAEDRRMANPDALAYNEYQKTIRQTGGLSGTLDLTADQTLSFTAYLRHTDYTESVPSTVQHRNLDSPGGSLQYTLRLGQGTVRSTSSAGLDLDGQTIDEYRRPNLGDAVEAPVKVSDQTADQGRAGFFLMERLELGARWAVLVGLRHDRIRNTLDDHLKAGGVDLSGERVFQQTTGRVGATFSARRDLDLYASWGQGFLPPATEELYANPDALGGFNASLVPATSRGEEVGLRGNARGRFYYDVALFHLDTRNDFERYRIAARPLETFYGNAGDTRRFGLESQLKWFPARSVAVTVAYTWSHFTYTRYDGLTYTGDLAGNTLPNWPRHLAFLGAEYTAGSHWVLGVTEEIQSRAYVDATNATWIDAYALLGLRAAYRWRGRRAQVEAFVSGRNVTGVEYIAFTEPDPDGNSYHPGPTAEVFAGVRASF